jgi:phage terminase large subunit-like protein
MSYPENHPMTYSAKVLSGEIPACRQIKLACERHLNDLKTGASRGLVFSEKHASHVIWFSENLLKFTKGKTAGENVKLELWQKYHLWCLFGWRTTAPGNPRRFRRSYLEIPRKNGKTTLAAIVILYTAFFENEARAQNYTVATKREQARLCLKDAQAFVRNSEKLNQVLDVHANAITLKNRMGKAVDENFIQSLSSESSTMDGLDIHTAVVDELHAHKTRDLLDVITTATGARVMPLIYMITTAGSNMESVCFEQRTYVESLLSGEMQDDTYHGIIYTLDQTDDFREPQNWIKANPNLGVSKYVDYIESQINQANNMPGYENSVKRLDFNIWTSGTEDWITRMHWDSLKAVDVDLDEYPYLYLGLDLAATSDFNCLAMFFANPEADKYHIKTYFWIPQDGLDKRKNGLPDLIRAARKHPQVMVTPGNVMDDRRIVEDIQNLLEERSAQKLCYDPYQAHSGVIQDLVRKYGEDFTEPQAQNISSMSEPTKQLSKLILSSKVTHDGNPVMNWMIGNVKIYRDANDNIKFHKGKSTEKIDGPVAVVNALAKYMSDSYEGFDASYLEDNDLMFLE